MRGNCVETAGGPLLRDCVPPAHDPTEPGSVVGLNAWIHTAVGTDPLLVGVVKGVRKVIERGQPSPAVTGGGPVAVGVTTGQSRFPAGRR